MKCSARLFDGKCDAVDGVSPCSEEICPFDYIDWSGLLDEVIFTKRLGPDGGGYKAHVDVALAEAIGVAQGDYVEIIMRRAGKKAPIWTGPEGDPLSDVPPPRKVTK